MFATVVCYYRCVVFVDYLAEKSTNSSQRDCSEGQLCELSGLRSQSVKQSHACDICDLVYARPKMLEKHRLQHASRQDVVQPSEPVVDHSHMSEAAGECRSASGNESMRHAGNRTRARVSKGYVCGECGENFDKKTAVKSHMFTQHMCK